jgi:MFS superfamily sulfate permease-like transporter
MDYTLYKITKKFNLFIEHMFFLDELFQKHTLINSFEFLVSLSCIFFWFFSLTYCRVFFSGIYFLLKVVIFFVCVVHEINIATINIMNVVDKR